MATSRRVGCPTPGIMRLMVIQLVALALALATPQQSFFSTQLSADAMADKQAVVETSSGTFVIQLLPEVAPNHVGHFMKLAGDGDYVGTTFHRVIRYGIIQGGDPLSRDPAKADEYGTGGLNLLKAEINAESHTAGAVAAVLVPGDRDSAGAQFFVCASDQVALDGQYTVFGRVVDGLEVVQSISAVDANEEGRPASRIEITAVTIRDTPPPPVVPFSTESAEELAEYHAVLETSMGEITLEFLTDIAPEHSRAFLRRAQAGLYDLTPFHRAVKGFVIQTGAVAFRTEPLTQVQNELVHTLEPEFSETPTLPGIVSMARGEDPASATTSFFICAAECRSLDGVYTAFARVVVGMDVVSAIESVPVSGEAPIETVLVTRVRVERR